MKGRRPQNLRPLFIHFILFVPFISGLFLDCRLAYIYIVYCRNIDLGISLVGVKTVLFLLYIVKLSVAETVNLFVVKHSVGKTLVALNELFTGSRRIAVAPCSSAAVLRLCEVESDSAVFADKDRLSFVRLLVVGVEFKYLSFLQNIVPCTEALGVLVVVRERRIYRSLHAYIRLCRCTDVFRRSTSSCSKAPLRISDPVSTANDS